jgi:hypothetical protein
MFFSHTTLSSALYYRCHQELPPHPDAGQGPDASSIVFDRPTAAPTYRCNSPTPVGRYLSLTHRRPSRASSRAVARAGCHHAPPPEPGATSPALTQRRQSQVPTLGTSSPSPTRQSRAGAPLPPATGATPHPVRSLLQIGFVLCLLPPFIPFILLAVDCVGI